MSISFSLTGSGRFLDFSFCDGAGGGCGNLIEVLSCTSGGGVVQYSRRWSAYMWGFRRKYIRVRLRFQNKVPFFLSPFAENCGIADRAQSIRIRLQGSIGGKICK